VVDQVIRLSAPAGVSQRLDRYLVEALSGYTRSRLQGLVQDGLVVVDGRPAHKSGLLLAGGESIEVRIPPPQPTTMQAEAIPLQIIFENADLIVVDKPAGMVVHPAVGHAGGTLVNAALAHAPEMEGLAGEGRPGVVHRLDRDTSGLILLAKNDTAHRWLQDQFRLRKVQKTYLALVDGRPPSPTGRVEAAVGRDPAQRKRMAIATPGQGRMAVSEYQTLETFAKHSLLEVHPITGRTHQIRLHLAFLGCPVAGDVVYGRREPTLGLARQFLHAARLRLHLPGEDAERSFAAPLPPDLAEVLNLLRQTA
jgi:23S rRNA pseudouridine1911/1915/1917 synthase